MSHEVQTGLPTEGAPWVTWCCSYCGGLLRRRGEGLFCPAEDRSFATESGVHRLLSEERRREIRPFVELYQRVRREEGWRAQPGLPEVPDHHPHAGIWRQRASSFRRSFRPIRFRSQYSSIIRTNWLMHLSLSRPRSPAHALPHSPGCVRTRGANCNGVRPFFSYSAISRRSSSSAVARSWKQLMRNSVL